MVRRIAAVFAALAMSLIGFVGIAGSAHAYVSENGSCEWGEVCMWKASWMGQGQYDTGNSTANFATRNFVVSCSGACTLNDQVSSVRNLDRANNVRFFEHANYGGAYFNRTKSVSGQTDDAMDLSIDRLTNGASANDQFSSFCFVWANNPVSARCRG